MDFWIDLWVSIAEQGLLCYVLNDTCKNRNGLGNCFFFFLFFVLEECQSTRGWVSGWWNQGVPKFIEEG